MDINGKEFRDLVTQIVTQILREKKDIRQRLYVIFEDFFDDPDIEFLRTCTGQYSVYVIVPDTWLDASYAETMRGACPNSQILPQSESGNMPIADSLTVYPAASRAFIAKTALGISDTFATQWAVRCMAQGGAMWILQSGLEKFTGREPQAYIDRLLSYYRTLLLYGIGIGNWEERGKRPVSNTASLSSPALTVTGLVTAADIEVLPDGITLTVTAGTIVTDLARERAAYKGIRFV